MVVVMGLGMTRPARLSAQFESKAGPMTGGTRSEPLAVSLAAPDEAARRQSRNRALVASLTIFVLAVFVGFEVISKVPTTLHTPLMSGSNAISGITVVGAIVAAGSSTSWTTTGIGVLAVVLAMVNVVGGFLVTHRMLMMFQRR
jgi:NAD(P) transhydrogenase subunit alpha